ncbi:VOC family protein [Ekhidna sp.]
MHKNNGAFRFTYFTDKYDDTCDFYGKKLEFNLEHSWDRNEHDKGALFKVGAGLIEVLLKPNDEENRNAGLDYRIPQGAFMCIQVENIDQLFNKYKAMRIPFKQEIVDQAWGHRSFSILEPNGLVLFFFQEQF